MDLNTASCPLDLATLLSPTQLLCKCKAGVTSAGEEVTARQREGKGQVGWLTVPLPEQEAPGLEKGCLGRGPLVGREEGEERNRVRGEGLELAKA